MIVSSQKFLLIYVVFLLIASFERIASTFFKQKTKPTRIIYHNWIFNSLLYGYIAVTFLSIIEFFSMNRYINPMVSLCGFIFYICGATLRQMAMSSLGDNWSIKTEIKEKHVLVKDGVYKYLKHPYYIAVILELFGICLIANAFYSLIFVFFFQFPLILIRINLEEKVLLNHFGDAYKKIPNR